MLRSAIAQMLPPRPPSPPSGPPRGMYFSRRNDAAPFPPSPATTSMYASSMNFTARNPCDQPVRRCRSRRILQVENKPFGRVATTSALPGDVPAGEHRRRSGDGAILNEQGAAVRFVVRFLADRRDPREVEQQCALGVAEVAAGDAALRGQLGVEAFEYGAIRAARIEIGQPDRRI